MLQGITNCLSLICNLAIAAFMVKSLVGFFTVGGSGNMQVKKTRAFVFFTVQSNLFMAVCSAVMLFFNVTALLCGGAQVPYWFETVKFTATVAVSVTLFVVMLVFVPTTGLKPMIDGDNIFLHLISPVLAIVTFVLFDGSVRLAPSALAFAMIPVFAYAVLYYIMVIIVGEEKGGWSDFYYFNKGGKWYLSALGVFGMALTLAFLIRLGHNALACGLLG